jgi:beta-xylosidase
MRIMKFLPGFLLIMYFMQIKISAQPNSYVSKVWVADLGDGNYKNPVLHADYSDPDVCRVGEDFYMVASSFDAVPGLPILHSKDLVNWTIIGHALKRQPPFKHFEKTQHGNGVWAPAIRFHNDEFYLYYPDPDFGIYLTKAKNADGPWSQPQLVEEGKGLIDPCPLWDNDGKAYLVHAYAGSRAGIKSIIVVKEMNAEGTKTISEGKIVYDGHETDPTIEGPKFHKRNGFYYIFAPAGGVATGWQLVLRSKNIYGPYERKVAMDQGATAINGPHQGAWIDTPKGEDWFIHFQDKEAYGRVVHLQPLKWKNDWPVIGINKNNDGKGEPVLTYKKPDIGKTHAVSTPVESDEFNETTLGLQWQWQANPKATWAMPGNNGRLRLYSQLMPDSAKNLWDVPNVLMQKIPAEEFVVTTKVSFKPNLKLENERTGLVVMGQSYAGLILKSGKEGTNLVYTVCNQSAQGKPEIEKEIGKVNVSDVYLRFVMKKGALCSFSYSFDGEKFIAIEDTFQAVAGRWIGAKMGIFCARITQTNDSGYADFDWFRVEPVNEKF